MALLKSELNPNVFIGPIKDVYDDYRRGVPTSAFGLPFSGRCHLVSYLPGRTLFVVKDFLELSEAVEQISALTDKKVIAIPDKEEVLFTVKALSKETEFKRISAIHSLLNEGADIAVITIRALTQIYPKSLPYVKFIKNNEYERDFILKNLVTAGYVRSDSCDFKGSFSLRGDILDIYPINSDNPVRIDFFGDEIERIKTFDVETGKTLSLLNDITVTSATDIIIDDTERGELKNKILQERKTFKGDDSMRFFSFTDDILTALDNNAYSSLNAITPLLKNSGIITDLAHFDGIVYSEPKQLYEVFEALYKEHSERFNALYKSGEVFSFAKDQMVDKNLLLNKLNDGKKQLALLSLVTDAKFFTSLKLYSISAMPAPKYHGKTKELVDDVLNWLNSGYKVMLCCDTEERVLRLNDTFYSEGVILSKSRASIVTGSLLHGFIYHDEKFAVIGYSDVFSKIKPKAKKSKKNLFFSAPEAGDYAVHEVHGVGKVLGTKKLTTTFGTKDYVAVSYLGGAVLYVPVEQLDSLTKYVGSDKEPKLSRLGGKDFERVKNRVKESLRKLSFDLKQLYKERSERVDHAFTEDTELQTIFDSACGFEETPDQITASEDITRDMCSRKVMDRLICGDVGFGKTEVAFRAVFRAVADGKQVALLAPTTILAEQHYKNALKRFEDFGIKIESLDRFKTKKQQAEVLEKLKNGQVDFIIGTHRLLSKDVAFNDLGLLVLDEEQRFGVEHKEKIKLLKKNVDTLTLTATPIPRTLHMSLSGIRDISTINTPPKERLPVQTYVTEETDALLFDAVSREYARGGQTFILYNRVESIYTFADKLQKLLPKVKITVAHGQMAETELEKNVNAFYSGATDVLLATTIIENGIDLPRANTIIVIDADKLGLSTLYQLRGRVGRSNRLAHAYFTFKKDKVLSDVAYKRLSAIMEFTEMGSGFKIAMRDLEIRGAGNILGVEQHGHMDKIGYELYSKLLKEEMEGVPETVPLEMDARLSAYIPDHYIESQSGRMDAYKEIAEIESKSRADELLETLADTYGTVPKEVKNLVYVSLIKALAKRIKAKRFIYDKNGVYFGFENLMAVQNENIFYAIDNTPFASFIASENIGIKILRTNKTDGELLKTTLNFLALALK